MSFAPCLGQIEWDNESIIFLGKSTVTCTLLTTSAPLASNHSNLAHHKRTTFPQMSNTLQSGLRTSSWTTSCTRNPSASNIFLRYQWRYRPSRALTLLLSFMVGIGTGIISSTLFWPGKQRPSSGSIGGRPRYNQRGHHTTVDPCANLVPSPISPSRHIRRRWVGG